MVKKCVVTNEKCELHIFTFSRFCAIIIKSLLMLLALHLFLAFTEWRIPMTHLKKFLLSVLLCFSIFVISTPIQNISAKTSKLMDFILLTHYNNTLNIGEDFYLAAITSTGKKPTFKSSDSKIASVSTYGKVLAKKAGTVTITAKIKDAEAYCIVTVNPTEVSIKYKDTHLERGDTLKVYATTSNGSKVTWKSNKKSVATVDDTGLVTCIKPGEAIITATADGSSASCVITVKPPTITLNKTNVTLYRGQTSVLSANISSIAKPTWRTNKKSVAIVDENGLITAMKNGIAIITCTADGVASTCEVVVEKPTITLNSYEVNLKVGETYNMTATVSSKNKVIWSTSNQNILNIDANGKITGLQKGKAYVYAAEDGTKIRCTVLVTE